MGAPKVSKIGRASHTEQGEVRRQSFQLLLFFMLSQALGVAVRGGSMERAPLGLTVAVAALALFPWLLSTLASTGFAVSALLATRRGRASVSR